MDNQKISLAIFGNQNSNSGFQPLYWINNPVQQLENLVPPGMDDNSYFFVLQVTPTQTLYTLVQNRVSSYMSSRPGALKMAIGIPQGWRIEGGDGPFELLLAIREKFLQTCMTQNKGANLTYNFNEKLADSSVFEQMLDDYVLEPSRVQQVPMTGNDDALLLLTAQNTSLLFKDPQRPEFAHFKRIVIGEKGKSSSYQNYITGLDIPRKMPAAPKPDVLSNQHQQPSKPAATITDSQRPQQTVQPQSSIQKQTAQTKQETQQPRSQTESPSRSGQQASSSGILHKPWFSLITFVVGAVLGYFIGSCNGSQATAEEEDDDDQELVDGDIVAIPGNGDEDFSDEQEATRFAEEQLNKYNALLTNPSLTYEQIDEMIDWIANPDITDACNAIDPQFVNRVRGYNEIIDFLRLGDIQGARQAATRSSALSDIHLNQMRAAYQSYVDDNGETRTYSQQERAHAQSYFQENFSRMHSFADINAIHAQIQRTINVNPRGGSNNNRGGHTEEELPQERE